MAPERPAMSLAATLASKELHHDQLKWPLSAHVVRQIQREVARSGRSLQRLEVQGAVIDNFDSLGPLSPSSLGHAKRESVSSHSSPHGNTPGVKRENGSPPSWSRKSPVAVVKQEQFYPETPVRPPVSFIKRELEFDDEESEVADRGNYPGDSSGDDNDLTNLTWLQDSNLIRNIHLTKGETDELRPGSVQMSNQSLMLGTSPTSDYLDDSFASEPADSCGSDQPLPSPCPSPSMHTPVKNLIPNGFVASNKSSGSVSKLKHPHNVPYNPLVHTQNKPPYSFSCLIFMAIEDSPKKALPVKDIYSWILEHFPYFRNAPTGWKNSVRHNLSLNKCFLKVEKVQSLGKGSLWMVDDHYRSNLLQAFSRSPFHPCCPTLHSPSTSHPSSPVNSDNTQDRVPVPELSGMKGAPNPELFPFLSRRLAATNSTANNESLKEVISDHDSTDSLDEVVAAAMVLALKHGPGVLPPPVISSCPTQDHTYSAATGSPETGYESDEEQRRTAEALLHLAGLPPAPETDTPQNVHRPRLLRRAPKRAASSPICSDACFERPINNNCGSQTDRNLLLVQRNRTQPS